jgi:flagellar biosynthesis/type III secretory pathway chaperone
MKLLERRDFAFELTRLLDQERIAVLKGDFDALKRLAAKKERLIALLVQGGPLGDQLERLRRKAERNHTLLEAAARGVRSVIDKIEISGAVQSPLKTYDKSGQRQVSLNSPASVERRI